MKKTSARVMAMCLLAFVCPMSVPSFAQAPATPPAATPAPVSAPTQPLQAPAAQMPSLQPNQAATTTTPGSPAATGSAAASALTEAQLNAQEYPTIDFRRLIDLSWKFGLMDIEDPTAVKDYITTTECALFKKYSQDEFNWPAIVRASKDYLAVYPQKTGTKFSIVQPIGLERYNPDKEWFKVSQGTQYLNVVQLEIADFATNVNRKKAIFCDKGDRPRTIPLRAMVRFSSPFSITYIPMKKEFARHFLDYIARQNRKPLQIKSAKVDRFAFVQFRFTLHSVEPRERDASPGTPAKFNGRLDSFDIYADEELTLPIFSWKNDRIEPTKPAP